MIKNYDNNKKQQQSKRLIHRKLELQEVSTIGDFIFHIEDKNIKLTQLKWAKFYKVVF